MRTLCLLLILANALFFIWSQLIDAQVNALDRISPPSAAPPARIVLAREVVRENVEEDAPAQVSEVMPPTVEPLEQPPQTENAPVASCTSIGPFPDLPQAAEVQSTLRAKGHESRQRVEQGEWWVGYWVSVPNLDTRAAAQAAIEKLRNN
ncbi:MAG TPA: SPOR domain-containing protein, partial [Steroidobacter sp.]|nr:SPOR domain-containing protein [Steroidobacter sp.]